MAKDIDYLIKELKFNTPTSKEVIVETGIQLGVNFPKDYIDFMIRFNGGEGIIGNSYLVLWSSEELVEDNEGYAVKEFADGLVLFGSDGGGTAYAFDSRYENMPIVEVPFIGMDLEEINRCSDTFIGFLEYLYEHNS
ncbi:SMI1/KNR4 family protein [Paenibacillus sp. 2RAB27]|uniref:SMI1/KNR4 family protein n=1 Tax=Paenibacillus sp. 2RAB27 TaxID=3232991 RepID=UPI003F99C986